MMSVNTNRSRTRSFWGAMAAATVSAMMMFTVVGCGSDDDEGGGTLTLPEGQAWTTRHEDGIGESSGLIFADGGVCYSISDFWGFWDVNSTCTWSTNGSTLTIKGLMGWFVDSFKYSVSGNSLYLSAMGMTQEYRITDVDVSPDTEDDKDYDFINVCKEAWTGNIIGVGGDADTNVMYAFNADGESGVIAYSGVTSSNSGWFSSSTFYYRVRGNRLTFDNKESASYDVSDNTLTLTYDNGIVLVLTKTPDYGYGCD